MRTADPRGPAAPARSRKPLDEALASVGSFADEPGQPELAAAARRRRPRHVRRDRPSSASARSFRRPGTPSVTAATATAWVARAARRAERRRRGRQLDPDGRRSSSSTRRSPPPRPAPELHANPYPNAERPGVRGRQRGLRARAADRQPAGRPGQAEGGAMSPKPAPLRPLRPYVFALGMILALVVVAYFAFNPACPFKSGYRVEAVFKSSNGLRKGSPVRIAGVDVGKVVKIADGPGSTTVVTMEIDDNGRPLHTDATARIRPRVFLEGGFAVELKPGQPERAGARRQRADPALADRDPGSVPPGADRVRLARAREPPRHARRAGHGPGRRRRGGAEGARAPPRSRSRATSPGSARACSGTKPHDMSAADRLDQQGGQGARPQPGGGSASWWTTSP